MSEWNGIWIPLVTPWRAGEVDHGALARLVKHLAAQGVAGFVAGGSTGEAALMSEAEQEAVLETVQVAAGALPVVMGLAGPRTEAVAARARHLGERFRPAALLVSAPGYVRPSQAGLVEHFTRIADASPCPVVLYDIPARTGVRIEARTLLALAGHPRIVAVKDCSGDRSAAETVLADGRLAWLAGNDDELFDQLARGAAGGVVASAHLATAAFVRLHARIAAQRLGEARALWHVLAPLTRALFAEPNPAPLKGWLAREGWMSAELRPPLLAPAEATLAEVGEALRHAA